MTISAGPIFPYVRYTLKPQRYSKRGNRTHTGSGTDKGFRFMVHVSIQLIRYTVDGSFPVYGKTLGSRKRQHWDRSIRLCFLCIDSADSDACNVGQYGFDGRLTDSYPDTGDKSEPDIRQFLCSDNTVRHILVGSSLLYSPATRFVDEKTAKGKAIIVALALLGAFVVLLLPFNKLLNIIYVVNGYVGIIFIILVVIKVITRHVRKDISK